MRKGTSAFYRSYINSPRWAERKRDYYSRHPRRCAACGTTERVDLHHVSYARLGNELDEDLLPLCRHHHKRATAWTHAGVPLMVATQIVVYSTVMWIAVFAFAITIAWALFARQDYKWSALLLIPVGAAVLRSIARGVRTRAQLR